MMRFLSFFSLFIFFFSFFSVKANNQKIADIPAPYFSEAPPHIALTFIADHPSLQEIQKGLIDQLKKEGFIPERNIKITVQSAQGNYGLAVQIAQKYILMKPSLIIGLSTLSAQAIMHHNTHIPFFFSAVSDPIQASLITSYTEKKPFITGNVDRVAFKKFLPFLNHIHPHLKEIGFIYNLAEKNSLFQKNSIEKNLQNTSIHLKEIGISKNSDIPIACEMAAQKIDAFLIPNDNLVMSGLEMILSIAEKYRKPVYTFDPQSVKKGATASLGCDQYKIGQKTGEQVALFLKGIPIKNIPIEKIKADTFYINQSSFKRHHLTLPSIAPYDKNIVFIQK